MTGFTALIEATLAEFTERMPTIALPRLLVLPTEDALKQIPVFHAATALFGVDRARAAFDEAFAILESHGAKQGPGLAPSPLTEILGASILDALAVRAGELDLIPIPDQASVAFEIRRYGDRRYLTAGQGPCALIVLNALGVSHHCWERLARTGIADHRLILFESRSADLECGGMKDAGGIDEDVADLLALVEHENFDQVVLLGWCSGARAAIEFAWRHPDRLRQLILLAPTLRQTRGIAANPSPFEDNLERVFKMVNGRASLAGHFVRALVEAAAPPDDAALIKDLATDGALFLSLPRHCNAGLVLQPFTDGPSLLNYGKRIAGDITAMTVEKLKSLTVEMLLIQGDRDGVVNNLAARNALRHCQRPPTLATVVGAGHYPHDLQYLYIRKLIADFTGLTLGAQPCARIAIAA